MYYEIQPKKLPRKQNISVRNRNRDVCDSCFISIFSPFTFWLSLLRLHTCFFLFLKIPFFFFSPPRCLLITLYTPWAQMTPVKMHENAKWLITQTQRTNIMFHSGSSSSVSKASHAWGVGGVGGVFIFWWSGVPSSPLMFCAHVRTWTRGESTEHKKWLV